MRHGKNNWVFVMPLIKDKKLLFDYFIMSIEKKYIGITGKRHIN